MKSEKFSSMHDDLLVPKSTEHLGEYNNYPERFDPEDKSVLARLEQFGIGISNAEEKVGKKINQFTWDEYNGIIAESIRLRYDVVVGSVFDKYMFPSPENPDTETRVKEMFSLLEKYEKIGGKAGVTLIKRKGDFKESGNLVLGLEAGAHLITSIEDIKELDEKGVRLFGLQYGRDTPLATSEGLTKFGKESVEYMLNNNLIVDLAHSGFKARQDVIKTAGNFGKGHLVSYTHGSQEEDVVDAWRDKISERPLKKEEVNQIIKLGGIIGLGVTQPFFESTGKIAERIDSISQLDKGINGIAIGSDFGGIPPEFTNDIKNPEDLKILGDMLSEEFDMRDNDIKKILRSNIKTWIKKAID